MLPLLIVLGATGALLEVKRLVSRPPRDSDLISLQRNEEKLKRVLQEVQTELQQERSAHRRDQARAEELERVAEELRAAHTELARRGRELETKALGLTEENSDLQVKVQKLETEHAEALQLKEQEFEEEVERLKHEVARAFEAFTEGETTAEALLGSLSSLGVEVELTEEDLSTLPRAGKEADTLTTQQVELQVDSNWRSRLRLLTDDPERMARQLAEGAHRFALPAGYGAFEFPIVRTPPRERKDGSIFSSVPALAMSVFTPRAAGEKENQENLPRLAQGKMKETETQHAHAQTVDSVGRGVVAAQSTNGKKPATPTRKKPHPVPRLGLSVVLRGDQARSSRDAFALEELSLEEDDHRMLHRGLVRN